MADLPGSPLTMASSEVASSLWTLLEHATAGVWYWDTRADRVSWSPRLLATLGVDADTALTLADIDERTHPEDRAAYRAALETSRRDGVPYRISLRLRHANGQHVRFLANGLWLTLPDRPQTPDLLGFLIDQSRLDEADAALARSEARFRSFFERCPAGVFIKDADGRHLFGNEAAAAIAGTDRAGFLGRTHRDLFSTEAADAIERVDREVRETGRPVSWTGHLEAGGRTRYVYDTKFPVEDDDGEATLVGGFGVDMTELHDAEQRLGAAQRLESLGLLASEIAHDFNNLLVGIRGSAELLRDHARADQRDQLATVISSATHASDLCSHLLAAAAWRNRRRETLDPRAFVEQTRDLLGLAARNSGELYVELLDDLPAIEVDPTELRQVLTNLVLNGVESTDERRVHVSVRCDLVDAVDLACDGASAPQALRDHLPDGTGRCVRFVVEDDGPGIPASLLASVFDPFFTTKPGGTGLGMRAVVDAVQNNEGCLRLFTAPGRGARFEILFAASAGPAPVLTDMPLLVSPSTRSARILVVDDDVTVARVVGMMLERSGHEVSAVHSGPEALERLADAALPVPELVVLDMSMPGMNGLETLQALRERGLHLPVLLASGFDEEVVVVDSDDRCGFLRKPFGRTELMVAVDALLDGSTAPVQS